MVARKHRWLVVLDTNVLISHFLSRRHDSLAKQIFQLWWSERQLQLVVSDPLILEYLVTFARVLEVNDKWLERWRERFNSDPRCTVVGLARRYTLSRDPDDNLLLATALAGKAKFLITNDRDLLDIPAPEQAKLPFAILTPRQFLDHFEDG